MENTFILVLPSSSQESQVFTGLTQILALVRRSDSVPVRSEGTRVLVNVIKSLFSSAFTSSGSSRYPIINGVKIENTEEWEIKKQGAVRIVLTPQCAFALASLVGRSGKYPQLINEGVVALSLMSTTETGGKPHKLISRTIFIICTRSLACTRCSYGRVTSGRNCVYIHACICIRSLDQW